MSQFYNPFNFVPLNDNPNTSHDVAYETIASGESHITHQLWQPNALSGAIFISITNHSDLIVGGEREEQENNEKSVKFFKSHVNGRLDKPNQLAIPANSLRGTIASVAETISDSAMRVLADEKYSVRPPVSPQRAFNALGIVVNTDQGLQLKPLTLSTMQERGDPVFHQYEDKGEGEDVRKECFYQRTDYWEDFLPVYVNVHKSRNNLFTQLDVENRCYHGSETNPKFVFVRDKTSQTSVEDELDKDVYRGVGSLKVDEIKTNKGSIYLLKGRELNDRNINSFYGTEEKFIEHVDRENLTASEFTRYIVFTKSDLKNVKDDLCDTKKYELLIPFDQDKIDNTTAFPIEPEAIARMNRILETTNPDKFVPRNWLNVKKDSRKVEAGDIYYFKWRGRETISELSYSQIWRSEVVNQSLHGIVQASGNKRYLPWGSAQRKANDSLLTPAEALFGVVEDRETDKNNVDDGKALASRVRFYDAVCLQSGLEAYSYSLTLDSPKPPSPSLYLHKPNGQGVGKADAVEGPFHINGRKRYIQHNKASEGEVNTGTDSMLSNVERLHSSTTPNFGFWIEFDNLSQDELSLLLLSTGSKQSGNENPFYHQIGMGKPYGFGKSELDVLTVLLKEPQQRYLNLSDAPSYSQVLSGYEPNKAQLSILKTLNKAIELPALSTFLSNTQMNVSSQTLRHTSNPLVNPVALVQVSALADESQFEGKEIGYPMPSPSTPDSKIFDWFGHNEENKQRLDNPRNKKPVTAEYQFLGKLPKDGSVKPLTKMKKPLKK
ncbi:TIGR03986 family CRISPR-associated RAMP protein [Vibrio sinaloensis]|uniref:CRISPR-associated protein n=1 Tax=Photobacterium sp. (strain ATCC 43367) TaxID=379097 RepID=A0A0A5JQV8_PHOS4|nr:TIGR03986 family CRISPR-associated RAMP protein [Vibrio sinaloensis]KGY10358.1 hypothetical protein NM06_05475 [Vibrio sinaloensis]